jgi:membrane associated rhomboid family serine protease
MNNKSINLINLIIAIIILSLCGLMGAYYLFFGISPNEFSNMSLGIIVGIVLWVMISIVIIYNYYKKTVSKLNVGNQ